MSDTPANTLLSIIQSPEPFTEQTVSQLKALILSPSNFNTNSNYLIIQARLALEGIDASMRLSNAIDRFDKTSGDLVNTTNKLTTRILWLTIIGIALALIQVFEGGLGLFSSK